MLIFFEVSAYGQIPFIMDYQSVKDRNIFHRRTKTEKILCALLVLVFLLSVLLGVLLAVFLLNDKKNDDLCLTSDCLTSTAQIASFMNNEVDPCEDFYEFSCGKYMKYVVIPPSKTLIDQFEVVSNKIDSQLLSILEEPIKPDELKPFKLVKKMFQACMNSTNAEITAIPTIKKILKDLGGWPVLEGNNWDSSQFDWITATLKMKDMGLSFKQIIAFEVDTDNKNSSRKILAVDQPFIPFEEKKRTGDKNNPVLRATHRFMVDLAVALGADAGTAYEEMDKVLNFIIQLVKVTVPQEDRRDLSEEYHPITIRELERNYPVLPWYQFVNKITEPVKMDYNDTLIVYLPGYLKKVEDLLHSTSKRTLANFLMYHTAGSLIDYGNKELRNIKFEFTKATVGVDTENPRNEECTVMASNMELAIGALYVRKYFNKETKDITTELVDDIGEEFLEILKNLDWMGESTKNEAIEKLNSMKKLIGYPDELLDDAKLEEYYKDVEITSNNYIDIILNVSKFQLEVEMEQLDKPLIKGDWKRQAGVATANAYYELNENSIQIPAGILQGLFFDAKRPQYLNFGGLGYIIGHEFTHGFDDEGSQMDRDGNLREWWDPDTKKAFDNKAECIINQYSDIMIKSLNKSINGITTQGENIADNGGIKIAYQAYKKWVSMHSPEEKLPSLDYTPEQLFWIGSAQTWCAKIRTEAMLRELESAVHSPNKYRVNIPFANSGFFAKDFNCPVGSPMNPKHTCSIW